MCNANLAVATIISIVIAAVMVVMWDKAAVAEGLANTISLKLDSENFKLKAESKDTLERYINLEKVFTEFKHNINETFSVKTDNRHVNVMMDLGYNDYATLQHCIERVVSNGVSSLSETQHLINISNKLRTLLAISSDNARDATVIKVNDAQRPVLIDASLKLAERQYDEFKKD